MDLNNFFAKMFGEITEFEEKTGKVTSYLLLIAVSAYTIVFSYITCLRHWSFYSAHLDLGAFEQAFWTTLHGMFFYDSMHGMSHFGIHNSPILVTFLPIYYLFPHSETLLIAKTILLAFAAIPLYYIGKHYLGGGGGLTISLVYLSYPALHGVNIFDFHEVAFVPIILFSAIYFLLTERTKYFIVLSLLCLLVKEDIPLVLFMLSLFALYTKRYQSSLEKYVLYGTLILYPLWLYLSLAVIIPYFSPDGYIHTERYVLDDGIASLIFPNIELKIIYLALLFAPLLLTPFLAPEFLILAGPTFAEILFQSPIVYRITTHYSAIFIPIIFTASILGIHRVVLNYSSCYPNMKRNFLCLLLITGVVSGLFCTPAPISPFTLYHTFSDNKAEWILNEHTQLLEEALTLIPADASVATQNNLAAHLSKRMELYLSYRPGVEYIFFDETTLHEKWLNYFDTFESFPREEYDLIFSNDGIWLFKLREA